MRKIYIFIFASIITILSVSCKNLVNETLDLMNAVAKDKAAIEITYDGNDSAESVTQNIILPAIGPGGTTVTWTSSNTDVIENNGTVTKPTDGNGNVLVVLTATISKGIESDTKVFNLTVIHSIMAGYQETYTADGVSFKMSHVSGGLTFPTGTADDNTSTVNNPYWIAETEVTYELWYKVYQWAAIGTGGGATGEGEYTFANTGIPGHDGTSGTETTSQEPVTTINWRSAMVWTNALTEWYNAQKGTSYDCVYNTDSGYITPFREVNDTASLFDDPGDQDNPYVNPGAKGFRLLTSMEWELAARYRGSDQTNVVTNTINGIDFSNPSDSIYWTKGNSASGAMDNYDNATANSVVAVYDNGTVNSTAEVKSKGISGANTLGLYDMSGNVHELCFTTTSNRVTRGGSWAGGPSLLQAGYIFTLIPNYSAGDFLGFRFARSAP
ncbi:immunoglobulin-like domain-containing protein [Spirochaetota bacterium]